jgi:hypothetical protein
MPAKANRLGGWSNPSKMRGIQPVAQSEEPSVTYRFVLSLVYTHAPFFRQTPRSVLLGKLGLGDGLRVAGGRTFAVTQNHAVGATADPMD